MSQARSFPEGALFNNDCLRVPLTMIVCPLTGELNMSDGALNTSEAV